MENIITIKGAYGETNFGDDLLMCVFENYFSKEFPDAKLIFEGEIAEYPSKLLKMATYNKKEENISWIVYGGGTQFFSFGKKKNYFKILKTILKNPSILKNKIFGKENIEQKDINTAFLGFGLGPFDGNKKAELNAQHKLSSASFIGVRDYVSKQFCDDWNLSCHLGADVVFSSYFSDFINNINKNDKKTEGNKKIGLIVRDWDWEASGKKYIDTLIRFYNENKTSGNYKIIVYAPDRDKEWMKLLKDEEILIWDPYKHTIKDFLNELNEFDAFISARYHGAIIGALLGKPVICVEIEPKLKILTEQVPQFRLWKKPFDINELYELENNINFTPDYSDTLDTLKNEADYMLNSFKSKFYE